MKPAIVMLRLNKSACANIGIEAATCTMDKALHAIAQQALQLVVLAQLHLMSDLYFSTTVVE